MAWGTPEVAEAIVAPEMTAEEKLEFRNATIRTWLNAKALMETAKESEMAARKAVSSLLFPTPTKGTQRVDIGQGYNIKLVYGLNYKLGNKELTDGDGVKVAVVDQVNKLEDAILGSCTEGEFFATRLIKWTPELVTGEYEKLAGENGLLVKKLVDAMLTIEPASPQLTFEEPKPAK